MAKEPKKLNLAEQPTEPELSLENLSSRIDKAVEVLNNIIAYCNTIEKWRTMTFKPQDQAPPETEESKK